MICNKCHGNHGCCSCTSFQVGDKVFIKPEFLTWKNDYVNIIKAILNNEIENLFTITKILSYHLLELDGYILYTYSKKFFGKVN